MIDRANYNTFNLEDNFTRLKRIYPLLEWRVVPDFYYDGFFVRYGEKTNWTHFAAMQDATAWSYEQCYNTLRNVLNLAPVEERKHMQRTQVPIRQQGVNRGEMLSYAYLPNIPGNILLKLAMYEAKLAGFEVVDDVMEYVDGFTSHFPTALQIEAKKGE